MLFTSKIDIHGRNGQLLCIYIDDIDKNLILTTYNDPTFIPKCQAPFLIERKTPVTAISI